MFVPPEPDPTLRLTIDKIDYTKLNYDDIRWICSSTMKQYHDEFYNLPNFTKYAKEVIYKNSSKTYIPPPPPSPPSPPPLSTPDNINFNSFKYITTKIPFIKKPMKTSNQLN